MDTATSGPSGLPGCCEEFARRSSISRRAFLRRSATVAGGVVATQVFGDTILQSTASAAIGGNVLVVLSLRGGIDGMGMVVPHGETAYYAARPSTAVPKASLLAADSMFGLHPGMAPLLPAWNAGQLAAVNAVGLPVANRSHFAAIEEIEDADPGSDLRAGWVNRMIGMNTSTSSLDAVQLGLDTVPTALSGPHDVLAATKLDELALVATDISPATRYASLDAAWAGVSGPLGASAREAVAISRGPGARVMATAVSSAAYPTAWPATDLSKALQAAARLIRADVGTEVISIDFGSWDLHNDYGTLQWGMMQSLTKAFAGALAAFLTDLGDLTQRVTVATISEFGRRTTENGNKGFDHGWGNMMLLAGAGVRGGRYHGSWPGLGSPQDIDSDLRVTTDYRNVLAEVVSARFPDRSPTAVFPGLVYRPLGVMG